ncbi:CorA family divalent cation transporter [Pontibacter ruber]|uniref:CorA family divalent cation transporter n=1 Tax=Pontibacter ruber TaxID=1343895 RepID=A0ABW5D035_9BACT|nr:CorA family divalent cation transporter [Pontibacter ruber]
MIANLVSEETAAWQWIDLESPTEAELQDVAATYGLHPSSVVDSLQPEHLPKYEAIGDIAFMIARVYDTEAHREADTIQELTNKIAIFFSSKFIITIHRNPTVLIKDIQEKYVATGIVKTPADLLVQLIKAVFRTYEAPARSLAEELDYYEAKTFLNKKMPPLTKGLYHLKRKATVCKRVLRLSEVILSNMQQKSFQPTAVQDLRDLYVHLETQYEEVNDGTNNLINTYISLSSQKTNEVMRVLTIFSAFFLPLTFIVGVYGMNFEFMPELEKTYGYPAVLFIMGLVTLFIYLWFRKKGWM